MQRRVVRGPAHPLIRLIRDYLDYLAVSTTWR
jgi:hypothetical protein